MSGINKIENLIDGDLTRIFKCSIVNKIETQIYFVIGNWKDMNSRNQKNCNINIKKIKMKFYLKRSCFHIYYLFVWGENQ